MAATTSSVYIHVIEDVVDKVRDEFTNVGGPGEDVLNELQALWELKMMQCGAICGPIERSSLPKTVASGTINPVHDLNVPYEGTEEYETPTAEILFPPTPIQTPIQTPLPGTVDTSIYPLPTGHNDFPTVHDSGGINEAKPGRPSPYMQPPSPWMNQRPLGVDVNIAYVEGRDEMDRGTSDQPTTQDFFRAPTGKRKREDYAQHFHNGGYIPQQDGPGDATPDFFQTELYPYQGVTSEDYNTVNTPANQDLQAGTPTVGAHTEVGDDDDEPPLNENDDDDLDDVDEEEEPNTQHLVLAQFDKVTRTKSRWKCTLKDGIMHINNKDILFTKATGEFDF